MIANSKRAGWSVGGGAWCYLDPVPAGWWSTYGTILDEGSWAKK